LFEAASENQTQPRLAEVPFRPPSRRPRTRSRDCNWAVADQSREFGRLSETIFRRFGVVRLVAGSGSALHKPRDLCAGAPAFGLPAPPFKYQRFAKARIAPLTPTPFSYIEPSRYCAVGEAEAMLAACSNPTGAGRMAGPSAIPGPSNKTASRVRIAHWWTPRRDYEPIRVRMGENPGREDRGHEDRPAREARSVWRKVEP